MSRCVPTMDLDRICHCKHKRVLFMPPSGLTTPHSLPPLRSERGEPDLVIVAAAVSADWCSAVPAWLSLHSKQYSAYF